MMATNEIEKKRFAYGNKGSVSFKPRMPVMGSRCSSYFTSDSALASSGSGNKSHRIGRMQGFFLIFFTSGHFRDLRPAADYPGGFRHARQGAVIPRVEKMRVRNSRPSGVPSWGAQGAELPSVCGTNGPSLIS